MTITFVEPQLVYAIEAITGSNGHGLLEEGELQVSQDGEQFEPAGTLRGGEAHAILENNRVRAVRLRATAADPYPLVVRSIELSLLVELSGAVSNPAVTVGKGNVATLRGDTDFAYPIGACSTPVINRGFTLRMDNGGNPFSYGGPISGKGHIELRGGGAQAPLVLDGALPNTLDGTWQVFGHVLLNKPAGVAALGGAITVGGPAGESVIAWNADDQIDDLAQIDVAPSGSGTSGLLLNGRRERIGRLALKGGAKVHTGVAGVLTVGNLVVEGESLPAGIFTASEPWLEGTGYVAVGELDFVEVEGIVKDAAKAFTPQPGSGVERPHDL